jgi:glycosyltransferase involved in cell wall biosynthesis
MNFLHAIGTLNPSYGGPVEALRHLSSGLIDLGHRSDVAVLDVPLPTHTQGFPGRVFAMGPAMGKYRYTSLFVPWLKRYVHDYDAVIVHGIWQYQSLAVSSLARRRLFPYFTYVHGALDPWFKKAFPLKHLKKWMYWPWAEYRALRDSCAVLFTSDQERRLSRHSFWLYQVHGEVCPLGIQDPDVAVSKCRGALLNRFQELRGKRILLFMGRLHRIKGLDLLIEGFAHIACQEPRLHLVVAGPDQDGMQSTLMGLADQLSVADRVTWTGMLDGETKWEAFGAAEALVLCSHSENFGMVVAEALACSLPVLITDKVNIWREIDTDGAGFVESDTGLGARKLLQRWINLSESDRRLMGQRARSCFLRRFEARRAAEVFVGIVQECMAARGNLDAAAPKAK